jgi:predicted DNA-binding protein
MATDNPRIQVMLDTETNGLLANLAGQQKRSISATAAELIREALELHEDMLLAKHGDERFKATKKWVSHDDAWK